jgi:hypothetical protein
MRLKREFLLIFILAIFSAFLFGQENEYGRYIKKADSLYKEKDYKNSALNYSDAFESLGWKGYREDRFSAARAWAMANNLDSAFFNLYRIATLMNDTSYEQTKGDQMLVSLHKDKRWEILLKIEKENKEKAGKNINKELVKQLKSIYSEDQKYRKQKDSVGNKFGWNSKEMKDLWKIINSKDSINLIAIKDILDNYGWLGADIIGTEGNSTLFLVIQHSDINTQEKYLPAMREAVKKGNASAGSLALLEDRVSLRHGGKQIYGSQVQQDNKTGLHHLLPLEDPDNVDKRRKEVGLPPLADYLRNWDIKWEVEQYKKDLQKEEEVGWKK